MATTTSLNLFPVFRLAGVAALLLVVLATQQATAQQVSLNAPGLINKMSRANRELTYDGVFVYQRGRHMDTMRIVHRSDANGETERLISLTGAPREVIRNNKKVTCIFPDDAAVMVEERRPQDYVAQLPEPIERIAGYYVFTIDGKERIAGRDSWVVGIRPKDAFRYGYQLWIDMSNYLLLKSELRNHSGIPLEQLMFTRLEVLQEIADELLQPSITGTNFTWYHNSGRSESLRSKNSWQATWVPAGFSLNDYEMHSGSSQNAPISHLIYSDGLATVSIFVEKLDDTAPLMIGPSRFGGVNTFTRLARGYQVTAVGEVPQATVQRIANSVTTDNR